MLGNIVLVLCSICVLVSPFDSPYYEDTRNLYSDYPSTDTTWFGKWFPQPPGKLIDDNPTIEYNSNQNFNIHDDKHGVKMGISDETCDDGKTNLQLDWDGSPVNYTCYENKHIYLPNEDIRPILECKHIPRKYSAQHACMNTFIQYKDTIPTFGTHRPLWAKFGEYKFLPKQRWVHNLEHGAIIMLYHPCANGQEVNILKQLVKSCLYRHIISPYDQLDTNRPLALVSWGCRLTLSKVDPDIVKQFISEHALQGPEQTSRNGQFDKELIDEAKIVSTINDDNLCPSGNM